MPEGLVCTVNFMWMALRHGFRIFFQGYLFPRVAMNQRLFDSDVLASIRFEQLHISLAMSLVVSILHEEQCPAFIAAMMRITTTRATAY